MESSQSAHHQPPYLVLFLIFAVLSVVFGLYYLSLSANPKPTANQSVDTQPTPAGDITTSPSEISVTPSPENPSYDSLPTAAVQPTPTIKTYVTPDGLFSVAYPSYRTVTIEKESTGQRYVFYSRSGNITVHVGANWSWQHPGRTFTPDLTVAGQPTFRYDTSTQSLIDFQSNNLDFTIQCVHSGKATLNQECDDFVKSFVLLSKTP